MLGEYLSQYDHTIFVINDNLVEFLRDPSPWMPEFVEKAWYKPIIYKGFEKEEIRLMGKIITEFILDECFSNVDESDTKTFLTSETRNLTIDMLENSKKI